MRNGIKIDENRYSDHLFISLTLQKLVRPDKISENAESVSSDGISNSRDDRSQQGDKGHFLRKLFEQSKALPASQTSGQVSDGFVVTHGQRSGHSYTQKLRTLQKYRGGSNIERIAFMESRSALTRKNLVVCAEQVSIFLLSGYSPPSPILIMN